MCSDKSSLSNGVLGNKKITLDLTNLKERLNVLLFYPSDWDPDSLSLLTSFSPLLDQLKTYQCSLYGCSTDSVSTHLNWIKTELGDNLNFPLISDPVGQLADKYSLYDSEERLCMRGVVVIDNKSNMLEVITSSIESTELAQLALNIVKEISSQKTNTNDNSQGPNKLSSCNEAKQISSKKTNKNDNSQGPKKLSSWNDAKQIEQPTSSSKVKSLDSGWSDVVTKEASKETTVDREEQGGRSLDSVWGDVVSKEVSKKITVVREARPVKPWVMPNTKEETWPVEGVRQRQTRPVRTWSSPVVTKCPACDKQVYPLDQVFASDRKPFHKTCINCQTAGCPNKLTQKGLRRKGGLVVCGRCDIKRSSSHHRGEQKMPQKDSETKDKAMVELKMAIGMKK